MKLLFVLVISTVAQVHGQTGDANSDALAESEREFGGATSGTITNQARQTNNLPAGSQMGGECLGNIRPTPCPPPPLNPNSLPANQRPIEYQAPAINPQTCRLAFPSLFSSTESPNTTDFTAANICRFQNKSMAYTYAEQCLAIWHATSNMTQFVNPRGGANNTDNQDETIATDDISDPDLRARAQLANRQDRQRQSRSGSQVAVNGIECIGRSEFDLDYPACKRFVGWYNALRLADTGLQSYNMYQQTEASQRGLTEAQSGLRSGDNSAALAGQQTSIQERAAGYDRTMAFNAARAAAITAQLQSFPNEENLPGRCGQQSSACCQVFSRMNGASGYFPNAQMKATMTAEIVKAVGDAIAAKLAADAARRQNELVGNIKEQMQDGNTNDPGLINNFCQLNPQDTRCVSSVTGDLPPGTFGSNGFTAGDFGSDSFGLENGAVSDPTLAPTTPDGSGGNVGAIGSVGNEARDAQTTFNTPGQGSSIGAPAAGGGGGGAGGGSAAAPGLSRDPGVQGEQKPADTKVTSLGAAYSGAAYNSSGGGGRGDRKPAAAENPFAQLFGKDKAAAEQAPVLVDPKFELFEAISNRHRTVWERKDLMEVK